MGICACKKREQKLLHKWESNEQDSERDDGGDSDGDNGDSDSDDVDGDSDDGGSESVIMVRITEADEEERE